MNVTDRLPDPYAKIKLTIFFITITIKTYKVIRFCNNSRLGG